MASLSTNGAMTTPQTFVVTTRDKLSSLAVENGRAIFVKDANKMYYDWDGVRHAFHDVVEVATKEAVLALESPVTNKLYIAMDNLTLWQYRGSNGWHCLTAEPQVVFIDGEFPSIGDGSKLYIDGRRIYRYDTHSKAFIEVAQNKFVWGNF